MRRKRRDKGEDKEEDKAKRNDSINVYFEA
jgi:hypothetical protein